MLYAICFLNFVLYFICNKRLIFDDFIQSTESFPPGLSFAQRTNALHQHTNEVQAYLSFNSQTVFFYPRKKTVCRLTVFFHKEKVFLIGIVAISATLRKYWGVFTFFIIAPFSLFVYRNLKIF